MENNENFVTEVTENVETTPTEESVVKQVETPAEKTYTQSEMDEIIGKRLARNSAKIEKKYERKYGELEEVLRIGTGKESVEEITDSFKKFYVSKGMKLPEKPSYTDRDIEVLAKAEADDIIRLGYEDVVEEVERLTELGVANMTAREKAYFKVLAEHRQNTERQNELSKIGVTEDVYNSKEFQDFAGKFNSTTHIADIWNIYRKTLPKKEVKPMGSMKQSFENKEKDYYSPEDIDRLTEDDLKNPKVWEAVRRSMTSR